VVEHFAKKKKEAKTVAKEENIKSKDKMTQVENEIPVRYIYVIGAGRIHKYKVSCHLMNYSRFQGTKDIFV